MGETRKLINDHAEGQRGLITRADMRDLGVTRHQRARLERDGTLVLVGRTVYRLGGVVFDQRARLLAGCLDTGGLVSYRSGAWLHGFGGFRPGAKPDVLVEGAGASYETCAARVHTTTWLPSDDRFEVDGIPCTSVARTLFGLAALVPQVPVVQVQNAVDDAIRQRLGTDAWFWSRLEKLRCRGRRGVATFEAVLSARTDGQTESWLEREFLRVLRSTGTPLPRCQARIQARGAFVARVDFLYEEARVVVEVTGAVAHGSPQQRAADARRRNDLARLGYYVLEFTYEQVVNDPERVVADVRGALAERRAA